jgi:hypothetical protein
MKKADIEARLAEHPETVFQCGRSYYLITGIVHEEGWRTNSRTWRVKTKHVGFNSETKTVKVGDDSSWTTPLSKVDWARFNDLESFQTQMIEDQIKREQTKLENNVRKEQFEVLSKDMRNLLKEIGTEQFVWIDQSDATDRVTIRINFDDFKKLLTTLQASIKTGVTA